VTTTPEESMTTPEPCPAGVVTVTTLGEAFSATPVVESLGLERVA
jgi:hypothetical protein